MDDSAAPASEVNEKNSEKLKAVNPEPNEMGVADSPTSYQGVDKENAVKVYERDFLLKLQFSPFAQNPKAENLLWPEYTNDGLFNPEIWNLTASEACSARVEAKKEVKADFFKPLREPIEADGLLRPQRRSFMSGCQMNTNSSSDRRGFSNEPESDSRPRSVQSTDRYDKADKKVGSGRFFMNRQDSRPDSRGSTNMNDKTGKPLAADKRDNWRQRDNDESGYNSHRESYRDGNREFSRHGMPRGHHHHYHHYNNHAEPEWFTEDVSMTDTIELKGFDSMDKVDKKKSSRNKKTENPKSQEKADVKLSDGSNGRKVDSDKSNTSQPSTQMSSDNIDEQFDFINSIWTGPDMPIPAINESASSSVTDSSSSRFSRWFKTPDIKQNTQSLKSDSATMDNLKIGYTDDVTDDLHVETHMSSLVQGLLSPGDDDILPSSLTSNGGAELLQMLQRSHPQDLSKEKRPAALVKTNEPEQLPDPLSKLLSSTRRPEPRQRSKPPLPATYKTLEELEAGLNADQQGRKGNSSLRQQQRYNMEQQGAALNVTSTPHVSHPAYTNSNNTSSNDTSSNNTIGNLTSDKPADMPAYDKLVNMLKVSGELGKSVPKMPEITNTETPNQIRRHRPTSQSDTVAAVESMSPSQQILAALQHPPTSGLSTITQQLRHASPAIGLANVTGGLPPHNSNLVHPAASTSMINFLPNGTPINIPPQVAAVAAASAATSAYPAAAPLQASVNPRIQQTIQQQQRQKLPSPIMFGNQPPGHIVAPAPIHPIATAQLQHLLSQSFVTNQTGNTCPIELMPHPHSHNAMFSNHPSEGVMQSHSAAPCQVSQPTRSVASMAFTPTSVIRKLANDKVDEKHRLHDSTQLKQQHNVPANPLVQLSPQSSNAHPTTHGSQQTFPANMRAITKSTDAPLMLEQVIGQSHHAKQNDMRQQQIVPIDYLDPVQKLLLMQQQQQHVQQMLHQPSVRQELPKTSQSHNSNDNNIFRWFGGGKGDLAGQGNPIPPYSIPKHVPILTLDDIEH